MANGVRPRFVPRLGKIPRGRVIFDAAIVLNDDRGGWPTSDITVTLATFSMA